MAKSSRFDDHDEVTIEIASGSFRRWAVVGAAYDLLRIATLVLRDVEHTLTLSPQGPDNDRDSISVALSEQSHFKPSLGPFLPALRPANSGVQSIKHLDAISFYVHASGCFHDCLAGSSPRPAVCGLPPRTTRRPASRSECRMRAITSVHRPASPPSIL